MRIRFVLTLLLLPVFFIVGCNINGGEIPRYDSDIVYQTMSEKKEIVGFYTISTKSSVFFYPNEPLIYPYYFSDELLAAIEKIGYPNMVPEMGGVLTIMRNTNTGRYCGNANSKISEFHPFGTDFSVETDYIIKVINPRNCEITQSLFDVSSTKLFKKDNTSIWSYAVNNNSPYLILTIATFPDLYFIRINLLTNEILDYDRFGVNPSISPDGKMVAYFSQDGIRTMDIDGNEKIKVTDDRNWIPGAEFVKDYVWPKPEWSPEGSQLIYHKCEYSKIESCLEYSDYTVYIYDIASGKEEKILDSALNPSWVLKDQ